MRVCLFVRPGADLIAITYAVFKLGAVPVLADPGMGRQRLLAAVEATGKGCRVAGERRSITSIARSPNPTRGDAEFLLLASASDCCGR